MRVANVDGLVTLFYDGSKELWNRELNQEWLRACRLLRRRRNRDTDIEAMDLSDACKSYKRERLSWQQIIIVEGVTEIPEYIRRVIFADSVIRIQRSVFYRCENLVFIKWSLRLEYIGGHAFGICNLSSVFIPSRCREIRHEAFAYNRNLTILNVSQDTELEAGIIKYTELRERYYLFNDGPLSTWLKNINHNDQFDLHRVCSSFEPSLDVILDTMIRKGGPKAFRAENGIGITPSRYLKENPYADIKEKDIIENYILQMMGEDL